MDLNQKAQWHLDFNGGMVPILETPAGDLIKESGVIAMFAHDQGKDHGFDLFPKDPIQAAKLRVEIENSSKYLSPLFAVMMSRGEDQEKNKKVVETVEGFSALLAKANGKFLFGTDEPTMLDVYYAPFLEILCSWKAPSVMENILEDCEFHTKGALIESYVEKWRSHELIKPWKMSERASIAHWARTRGWEKGVKCQLTVEYLNDAFDE